MFSFLQGLGEGLGERARAFRPQRNHRPDSKQLELHRYSERTLGTGNLREAVTLPPGEDRCEWLAMKTTDHFNDTATVFGLLHTTCNEHTCPTTTAGHSVEYRWSACSSGPVCVPAVKYFQLLFEWVQSELDDPALFPTEPGAPFPPDFDSRVRDIFRQLFRVFAHILHSHSDTITQLGAQPHVNTSFKHFMYTVTEFDLIPSAELAPLRPLIDKLFREDDARYGRRPRRAPPPARAADGGRRSSIEYPAPPCAQYERPSQLDLWAPCCVNPRLPADPVNVKLCCPHAADRQQSCWA